MPLTRGQLDRIVSSRRRINNIRRGNEGIGINIALFTAAICGPAMGVIHGLKDGARAVNDALYAPETQAEEELRLMEKQEQEAQIAARVAAKRDRRDDRNGNIPTTSGRRREVEAEVA